MLLGIMWFVLMLLDKISTENVGDNMFSLSGGMLLLAGSELAAELLILAVYLNG